MHVIHPPAFQRNGVELKCSSIYKIKVESMMRKILEGQQNMVVDFKKKLDSVYIELNGKFEFLNTYGKELDIQVQQINEVVKRLEKTHRQFFNDILGEDE